MTEKVAAEAMKEIERLKRLLARHGIDEKQRDEDLAVVTDGELERGEHPIGRLVHISSVTHAWRGVLETVTPSYYLMSREHPVALVETTGPMGEYLNKPTMVRDGDELRPKEGGISPARLRVPRGAAAWMLDWEL